MAKRVNRMGSAKEGTRGSAESATRASKRVAGTKASLESSSATSQRRSALLGILEAEVITDQDELRRLLAHQGHPVTQPSVSRDLAALGVVKAGGRYRAPASLPQVSQVALGAALRLRMAGPHLMVLKTMPGRASVVALEIDNAQWPEVVGTVAGDDTVFVPRQASRPGR